MSERTLFDKVWAAHEVGHLPDGRSQLLISLHLIHEVTSPQAFASLHERGLSVAHPERTFATVDHILPTSPRQRPLADPLAEEMIQHLEANVSRHGISYFPPESGAQGIVHMIGPEQGLTQPGMTICCGDSHTSTHGAFGAIAFGIGTSQVRDVLATQSLAMSKLKVRRIRVEGDLGPGVYAKDLILHIIRTLGAQAGAGYAYEFAGSTFEAMSMAERMTVCNMAIEAGARVGYINPDEVTFAYLSGRPYAPRGAEWEASLARWSALASEPDARYDDERFFRASEVPPTLTWGTSPDQALAIDEEIPSGAELADAERASHEAALSYMGLEAGHPILGTPVDVAFIGSCTNGRLEDLRVAADFVTGRHVAAGVRALVVPGSEQVRAAAEAEGIAQRFLDAGFEWRQPGCSMCLAMNPDRLEGRQLCASSSNRNFRGRQGSSSGRTVLMSPVMVAAAAITGEISDPRALSREVQ
ncbi:MAG: 3-isopropylmalate dehydratase large subunit [Myxococcota bacterium]|nr:3-isopropylmalate dehydratase large subunit [Myxococcota bacterium]